MACASAFGTRCAVADLQVQLPAGLSDDPDIVPADGQAELQRVLLGELVSVDGIGPVSGEGVLDDVAAAQQVVEQGRERNRT